MNTMGSEVVEGINKVIDLGEKEYRGVVIANQGTNFSVGANLGMVFMYAIEQEYDELNMMIAAFQNTMMKARYSAIPVIVAPHAMSLGGGCELTLHADQVRYLAFAPRQIRLFQIFTVGWYCMWPRDAGDYNPLNICRKIFINSDNSSKFSSY